MAGSSAATPGDYLAEIDPGRACEIGIIRDLVNAALPPGYVERMAWGMISWEVPLEVSGPTYNGQPLVYAALAAQKNHNALYLNCAYASAERTERLRQAFAASGRKLDMGKSCIRFKQAAALDLEAIRDEIASAKPAAFVALYTAARGR